MGTMALDGAAARSRSTDPVTSVDAGRAADLPASQAAVLNLLGNAYGGLTDTELVDLAETFGTKFSAQRLRTARAELTEAGLVVQVEGEFRRARKYRARVWELAPAAA